MEKKTSGKKSKIIKTIERLFNLYIMRSIIFDLVIILLGVFFILKPYSGLRGCEIAFSVVLLLSGISAIFDSTTKKVMHIFNFSLIYGVLSLIFGLLIIINPLALANIVTICFGIWMVLSGILKISYAVNLKSGKEEAWSVTFAIGLVTTLVGILLVFNPFIEFYITQVVGIFVVLYAALDLTNSILFKKRTKEIIEIFK